MQTEKSVQAIQILVENLFRIEAKPAKITAGQARIIRSVLDPTLKRIWIGTPTQYGKSLTIALACLLLLRGVRRMEKILIIAPSHEQARIIMRYILEHVFDHTVLFTGLSNRNEVTRLRTEFSKNRLAWSDGREVRVLSADTNRNAMSIAQAGKALMGHGGSTVICDEASLFPDTIMGKVLRMVGNDGKLVLIGNPFNEGYFYRASLMDRFHKVLVDWKEAVAEGRFTQEFVDEMRETLSAELFAILYEVKFVVGDSSSYIKRQDFDKGDISFVEKETLLEAEAKNTKIKVGVDVARSLNEGDSSAIYIRQGHKELFCGEFNTDDTMVLKGELQKLQERFKFDWANVTVDVIGVGAGLVDSLHESGCDVVGLNWGQGAVEDAKYFDCRTELWAKAKDAISKGTARPKNAKLIQQLQQPRSEYRYKKTGAVTKLEAKEQMKKRGIKSPDIADAFCLSYYESKGFHIESLGYS